MAEDVEVDWTPVQQALREGDIVVALEAFDALQRKGAKAPRNLIAEIAAAHVSRGNDLARRDLWELALERYRRARKLDPESGEAAFRMGAAFRGAGATGAALACLREAQAILARHQSDPFNRHYLADAYFNEGMILQDLGKLRQARSALRKALKVKPDYREVKSSLDEVLAKLPESDDATATVERRIVSGILDAASSQNADQRREAVIALRDFPEYAEAREAAMRLSDADPDPEVRFEARRTAGLLPRPGAARPVDPQVTDAAILAQALQAPEPGARREALGSAARRPSPAMAPVLAARLSVEEDAFALAQTIALLAQIGNREHAAAVEPFLAHPSCRVVANAIESIAKLAGELPLNLLLPLLESPDNRVRANALMSAVGARRLPVLDHLARMAVSDRESMRASALWCLERIDHPRAEEIALDLLRRETSPELTWKTATLLARIGTAASAPALEKLQSADPSKQGYAVYLLAVLADR